jgi:hypothetical protein
VLRCARCRIFAGQKEGTRFICKAPFTTNGLHFKRYVDTPEDAVKHIEKVADDVFGFRPTCYEIPYMMLQVRVTNNKECKVCFLNKEFSHIISVGGTTKSFPGFNQEEVILFASNALKSICHLDNFILDGLVRVDIFKSNSGIVLFFHSFIY